jgi:hypothetical protein
MTDFSFANLSRYFIEIEWVLTWFPIGDAAIDRPIMRNGTINHRSDDFGRGSGAWCIGSAKLRVCRQPVRRLGLRKSTAI